MKQKLTLMASSLPPNINVNECQEEEMYLSQEVLEMGTHVHPMEGVIIDLTIVRRQMENEYLQDDGRICEQEQAVLDGFDGVATSVKHLHAVDRAADLYKRQGPQGLTQYGKQQWQLAGLQVEPLDAA